MTAFIGVRISWLMLARKSDFARVASSAASLAAPSSSFVTFQIGNHAAGEGGGMILGFLGELAVRLGAKKLSLELLNLALEDLEPVGQIGGRRLGHGQPAMSNVTKLSL